MTQETNSFITKEVTDKVFSMIEQLAGVFGSTSSEIWKIYVIQSYRLAAGEFLAVLFCLFMIVVYFKIRKFLITNLKSEYDTELEEYPRDYDKMKTNKEYSSNVLGTNIIFAIFVLITTICFVVQLNDMIGYLINPEYYAIENVVKTFIKK
jgi:hypothetical protein